MSYYDGSLQFKRLLKKSKKTEVFDDRGPGEKWNFLHIHNFVDFAAKWVNIYILGILMSYYDGSLQLKRLSEKSKKLKFFMTEDLSKHCHFLHIHIFADFAAKWVTFYFLGILMSYYDDFLQFKRLSKK